MALDTAVQESTPAVQERAGLWNRVPRGLITISIGVLLLFLVSYVFAPSSRRCLSEEISHRNARNFLWVLES